MPQSISAVYIHTVFSTKNREKLLRDPQIRGALHAYLGEISSRLGCDPVIVGGVEDHVHHLARLGRCVAQAELVKELKRVSSCWLNEQGILNRPFQWQSGFAAFSVSQSDLKRAINYIETQESHHRTADFQEELRSMLERHNVDWDERYLWE